MRRANDILKRMHGRTPEGDALVVRAYNFAKQVHETQTRYSGEPYFNHVFETAQNLADIGMSATTVAAGLLHDALEDAEVDPETLRDEFGDEILFLVEGVTKLGRVRYRGTKRHNESLRKLFVAVSRDIRVIIIKLADRLHNIQTLSYVPREKQTRIATETLEIYAPVAYRLGIRRLSRSLEDYAFPYVYPQAHAETCRLLKHSSHYGTKQLERFSRTIKKTIAEHGIRDIETDYRIKGLYSLYRKIERKNGDIHKVHDVAALRVIVPTITDCYRVLGIVHSTCRPLPGRIKDYIAFPKPNGYQSLHTTIFTGDGGIIEVQIKTRQMYEESEYGIASHTFYKDGTLKKKTHPILSWIAYLVPGVTAYEDEPRHHHTRTDHDTSEDDVPVWIRQLVEYQSQAISDNDFQRELKNDFFEHRIFVFTPKGDVIDLPRDSSPVDFAYAIHSEIGNRVTGAKVNGKLSSLDTKLQNGDIVEILTSTEIKPSSKWLKFVKTTLAQRKIRAVLGRGSTS